MSKNFNPPLAPKSPVPWRSVSNCCSKKPCLLKVAILRLLASRRTIQLSKIWRWHCKNQVHSFRVSEAKRQFSLQGEKSLCHFSDLNSYPAVWSTRTNSYLVKLLLHLDGAKWNSERFTWTLLIKRLASSFRGSLDGCGPILNGISPIPSTLTSNLTKSHFATHRCFMTGSPACPKGGVSEHVPSSLGTFWPLASETQLIKTILL